MNWKTTLSAVVAALGTALAASDVLPSPWGKVVSYIAAAALALLGYNAADREVLKKQK